MSDDRKRVLFVDDDERVLAGLRSVLRKHRRTLDLEFELSPVRAARRLAEERFDVLVTDMRMPEMDGAELLAIALEVAPHTARVVLSGHADTERALLAMQLSHQYLAKPCDAERLRATVTRAVHVHEHLASEPLRRLMAGVSRVPSVPHVYRALCARLADPNAGAADIAAIVGADLGLSTQLLRLVNSPYFRRGAEVTDLERAVSLLGQTRIRDLTLGAEVFGLLEESRVDPRLALSARVAGAQRRARIAQDLAPREEREHAYLGGLLCDVGLLVAATHRDVDFGAVLDGVAAGASFVAAEESVIGASHGAIGAYLLALWGLPYPVVHAVARHQHEAVGDEGVMDAATAVRIGEVLITLERGPAPLLELELDRIAARVGARADDWRGRAAQLGEAA